MMLPLLLLGAWTLLAIVMLVLGYRRPIFHWALVVYFGLSCVIAVVVSFIRWGWPV